MQRKSLQVQQEQMSYDLRVSQSVESVSKDGQDIHQLLLNEDSYLLGYGLEDNTGSKSKGIKNKINQNSLYSFTGNAAKKVYQEDLEGGFNQTFN